MGVRDMKLEAALTRAREAIFTTSRNAGNGKTHAHLHDALQDLIGAVESEPQRCKVCNGIIKQCIKNGDLADSGGE